MKNTNVFNRNARVIPRSYRENKRNEIILFAEFPIVSSNSKNPTIIQNRATKIIKIKSKPNKKNVVIKKRRQEWVLNAANTAYSAFS